jgi:hypothetical protein
MEVCEEKRQLERAAVQRGLAVVRNRYQETFSEETAVWKRLVKLRGFSPQSNYTDRATADYQLSKCQLLRIEGVAWSAQRIPTAVNLGFLDRSRYFSIQVAPHVSYTHEAKWTPFQTHYFAEVCSQELWPLNHRGGRKRLVKYENQRWRCNYL